MTTKKPTTTTAPRAEYATKEPTELIMQFCDWIEREVGITLDADARRAVYLGSALRGDFQKSPANQARLAEQVERVAAEKVARAERTAARAAKAAAPKPAKVEKPKTKSAPAPVTKGKAPVVPSRRRPLPTPKVEVEA